MKEQYDAFFERLLLTFVGADWQNDLEQGKQEFYGSLGSGGEDLSGYERQVDLFFSWFLFTRLLESSKETPLEYVLSHPNTLPVNEQEERFLLGLAKHEKSIYEIQKIKDQQVFLKDLMNGEKRKVLCYESLVGFEKGQFLSTWIWAHEDQHYLIKGLCFHPDDSKAFLRKEIKKLRKASEKQKNSDFDDFFLATLRMKLKADKYHHIRPEDIYTLAEKVKL